MYGKTLVVGNGATDVKLPGGRNGFEVANWAISDWFADPRLVQRLTSQPDNLLMLVLTLAASALAALVYVYLFRFVRTRPFGYAIAFGGACIAAFLGIGAFEAISIAANYAFSQVSLALMGTVIASGVAARGEFGRREARAIPNGTFGPKTKTVPTIGSTSLSAIRTTLKMPSGSKSTSTSG